MWVYIVQPHMVDVPNMEWLLLKTYSGSISICNVHIPWKYFIHVVNT